MKNFPKIAEEYVKDELEENVHMLGAEYNRSSFLDLMCKWFDKSGVPYRYEKTNNNSTDTQYGLIWEENSVYGLKNKFEIYVRILAQKWNQKYQIML